MDEVIADSGCNENPELEDTGSPSALMRCQLYSGLPLIRLAARSGSLAELSAIIEKLGTRKKPMRCVSAGRSSLESAVLSVCAAASAPSTAVGHCTWRAAADCGISSLIFLRMSMLD
ncbi:hypothetical protein [Paraburkholderia dilworthii]|uniref:hypothetical protein n=1 Tax=Paraburkholderia dilworthii TaxID=948106 RepID=UPI001FCCBA0C|nr:hypothetical protein [Paraburkholderia dilworthii]